MNKQKKFLLLLALAFIFFAIVFFLNKKSSVSENPVQTAVQNQRTTMVLDVSGEKQTHDISGFVGKTALEATLKVADVEASGAGANAFVTTITGRKADPDKNEFWELIINGASAQVGAGSYTIMTGDSLEWQITTY